MWESILSGIQGVGDTLSKPLTSAWNYLTDEEKEEAKKELEWKFGNIPDFATTPELKAEPKFGDSAFDGYNFSTEGLKTPDVSSDVGWREGKAEEGMNFIPKTYEEWKESEKGIDWGKALKSLGNMTPRTGQQQASHSGPRTGGGTNIQTRDEYSDAMKMLLEKYGHLMSNKNF